MAYVACVCLTTFIFLTFDIRYLMSVYILWTIENVFLSSPLFPVEMVLSRRRVAEWWRRQPIISSSVYLLFGLFQMISCQYKVLLITEGQQEEMRQKFEAGISRLQNSAGNVCVTFEIILLQFHNKHDQISFECFFRLMA